MVKRRKSLRFLTLSAMMAALLALLSPWTLPVGAIPITLATFALFLVAATVPLSVSLVSTAVYLTLGAVGLPVFSGFEGGFSVFVGPTGGFLWGYLPAVAMISLAVRLGQGKRRENLFAALGMVVATAILYVTGTLWFAFSADATVKQAILSAVVSFLLPDAAKIMAAMVVSTILRRRFRSLLSF